MPRFPTAHALAVAPAVAFAVLAQALPAQTTHTYPTSALDFPNPERGFYRYSETRSGNYTPLVRAQLEAYRTQLSTPPSAGYAVYSTLVFRYFFLEDFRSSDISAAYLAAVQADFDVARAAGVKLIPRFAYTDVVDNGCGDFCPPYGDAAKTWVLRHIQQLTPVLRANADVTAAVQMGFVGIWGEQYYTDFFGDASQGPNFRYTDANWADRNEVLGALLDAVPETRQVQVRYPQLKQRYLYGARAPTTSAPITQGQAFAKTDIARLGFHNDCLLASDTDFGTYTDYGNDVTPSASDTAALKAYAAAEGRFVAVGGETCSDAYSPQNDCAGTDPLARADTELRRLGYSYLNSQFDNDVNDDWATGGCIETIKRELGYRFELQSATLTDAVAPGQTIDLDLRLRNVGYAPPFNPRDVRAVLRDVSTGEVYAAPLDADPRRWSADATDVTVAESLCVPADVPAGDYALFLHLPDPELTLAADPAYAIRLGSTLADGTDVWEAPTGYNALGHTLTVAAAVTRPSCASETAFAKTSAPVPVTLLRFDAEPTGAAVTLRWATAAERDNAGFDLERGTDAGAFAPIASLASRARSGGAAYAHVDTDVAPATTYYYRLRQRDRGGAVAYGPTVAVRSAGDDAAASALSDAFALSPNPTAGDVRLLWRGHAPADARVTVSDALGRTVAVPADAEGVALGVLPKGVYWVRVASGGAVVTARVVRE